MSGSLARTEGPSVSRAEDRLPRSTKDRKRNGFRTPPDEAEYLEDLVSPNQKSHLDRLVTNPTFAFQGTHQERAAFHIFCTRVTSQLSGLFDGWFWDRALLQASRQESAIRHAVLALSGLVQRVRPEDRPTTLAFPDADEGVFALQHYNLAIKELVSSAQKRQLSFDVCLITCLLFAYFEVIRRHHGSAMSHISSGVHILLEIQHEARGRQPSGSFAIASSPYVNLRSLAILFNTLNYHGMQLGGLPLMPLLNCQTKAIPTAFESIEEAHDSFQCYVNECVRLGYGIREDLKPERLIEARVYLDIFHQWHISLQNFLRKAGDSLSLSAQQAVRVMQLNLHALAFQIDVDTQQGQPRIQTWQKGVPQFPLLSPLAWDRHIPGFQQLLVFAREVVENSVALNALPHLPKFIMDTNIVWILYFVAEGCRDPTVRREAVTLLYDMPHEEGLWDSLATAQVCEKIISIEESHGEVTCCGDIPEWARVRGVKFGFDAEGRVGRISYRVGKRPSELDDGDCEEWLPL